MLIISSTLLSALSKCLFLFQYREAKNIISISFIFFPSSCFMSGRKEMPFSRSGITEQHRETSDLSKIVCPSLYISLFLPEEAFFG